MSSELRKRGGKKDDQSSTEPELSKWQKAFTKDAEWNKVGLREFPRPSQSFLFSYALLFFRQDDLLVVIYWARQIVAIIVGLLLGFMNVTGFPGILGFGLCSSFQPEFFLSSAFTTLMTEMIFHIPMFPSASWLPTL